MIKISVPYPMRSVGGVYSLHFLGCEPIGCQTTEVLWHIASAMPLDQYQIILLGNSGTRLQTTCLRLSSESSVAGTETATFQIASPVL